MTMSSVWAKESQGSYQVKVSGADGYGSLMEPTEASRALLDEYRPGIRRYSYANAAGSYKLFVGDRDVHVDFYAGNSPRLSERFKLR